MLTEQQVKELIDFIDWNKSFDELTADEKESFLVLKGISIRTDDPQFLLVMQLSYDTNKLIVNTKGKDKLFHHIMEGYLLS